MDIEKLIFDKGAFYKRAFFIPETLNEENRTIEIIWTTGAKVYRYNWEEGEYYQELSLNPAHVRLNRLNNGAPLLNSHDSSTLQSIFGVVEKAWLTSEDGRAIVRFSEREDVEPFYKDVKAGIIRNISVGFIIHENKDVETDENSPDQLPVKRAIDWEPIELSLVPIGADSGAVTRNINNNIKTKRENKQMEPTIDVKKIESEAIQRGIEQEKMRVVAINEACGKSRISDEFKANLINENVSIEDARAKIIDEISKRDSSEISNKTTIEVIGVDEKVKIKNAIENSLLHRANPMANKLTDHGKEFTGMSLIEIAKYCLEKNGVKARGLSKDELITRSLHSTSDFPELLANVATKTLQKAYLELPQSFRPFVVEGELPDFKEVSRVQLGNFPSLEINKENEEIKRETVGEGAEKYALSSYAKILVISRKAIINDDLSGFTRVAASIGRKARQLENEIVWAIITDNAAMSDTYALFSSNHANLAGSGAVISDITLGAGRAAMRKQADLSGKAINLVPKYFVVPASLETLAEKYIAQNMLPNSASDVNVFAGKFQLIVEPLLDANSLIKWYLFASPDQIDMIEVGYLSGQRGVYTETRNGFEVDGIEIKARHDFGAKALDYRGFYQNPGA